MPTVKNVHVDRPLTNLSVAFAQQAQTVSDKLFPMIGVQKQSDLYFSYPKGSWYRDEAKRRAPCSESAGSSFDLTTDSYRCDTYAYHFDLCDQNTANQDAPLNLAADATRHVTQKLLLRREKQFSSDYFTTGVWDTDPVPATKWDAAAGTPIKDIRDQICDMGGATGYRPNTLLLGQKTWCAIQDSADFIDRVNGGATTSQPAMVMPQLLAQLLELDRVLIAGYVENSAVEGAADSIDYMMGDGALLVHAAPRPALLAPSAGYTFAWTGYLGAGAMGNSIRRFRLEELRATRIEAEMSFDHKVVASELGSFFNSTLT